MKLSLLCLLLVAGSTFTIVESLFFPDLPVDLPAAASIKVGELDLVGCLTTCPTQVPKILPLIAKTACDAINTLPPNLKEKLRPTVTELFTRLRNCNCDFKGLLEQNVDDILASQQSTYSLIDNLLPILGQGDLLGKSRQQICDALQRIASLANVAPV